MAGYNPRNGSQYIANLNAIAPPSQQDMLQQSQDGFGLEDDLAMFTNAQFFDFDLGDRIDPTIIDYDPTHEERARRENASGRKTNIGNLEYMNASDFQFSEFTDLSTHISAPEPQQQQPQPQVPQQHLPRHHQPILPQLSYNATPITSPVLDTPPPASATIIPTTANPPKTLAGEKRKASSPSAAVDPTPSTSSSSSSLSPPTDEPTRLAAEEDKRRRNTAASARFRVKKKQREHALETTAKEMSDKCAALESRIGHLEMENKWLKNLITEKNENKDDIAEMWRKFNHEGGVRSTPERKDGVGTK